MKTLFLTITLAATAIFNQSSAQEEDDHIRFGMKAGANYSNVYDSEGEDFEANPKLGVAAGFFLSIPIGERFGIQPEILFSQKGFQATGRLLGSSYNFTRTTSFMDIPLLFAVRPIQSLSLLAGPHFSYLLHKRDVFQNGTTTVQQEEAFRNDDLRKNILGFTLGLDINVNHLVISGRAGFDIQNNNPDGSSNTPRYKNAWFQTTLGYRF